MASKGFQNKEEKYRYVPPGQKEAKTVPSSIKTDKKLYKYESPGKKEESNLGTIIIAVIMVLIVFSLAGFIYILSSKPSAPPVIVPPNETNVTENETNVTQICDDACNLEKAVNSSNWAFCKNINNISIRQECNLKLANVSLSACIELENKTLLRDCVILHAMRKNDSKTCSYLKEPDASSCLLAVNPCYDKSNEDLSICLALAKKDYSLCKGSSECIFNYSITTKTTDACHTLTEKAEEYACRAMVSDTDECAPLTLTSQKDWCYQIYAIRSNNSNKCAKISDDSMYAVECLSHFAVLQNDYKFCDSKLSFNNRWYCYTNYSLISGNVSGCVAIDALATTSRFSCLFKYAKNYGDPSACDLINDTSQSITCYIGSIMNNTKLDYTRCANIILVQWKNKCYLEYANLRNDSTFCDYITTENEKNSCLSNFK